MGQREVVELRVLPVEEVMEEWQAGVLREESPAVRAM